MVQWTAQKVAKTDPQVAQALLYNNRFWRGLFHKNPRGWGKRTQSRLKTIVQASKTAIQKLTDQFVDPSGTKEVVQIPPQPEVLHSETETKA